MPDPFIQAVIDNDVEAVRTGLASGRDPNLPDRYCWIPLHRAAANDSAEVAEVLLQAGSSLVATGTDNWTPLHLAAVSGSSRMVKVLVEAGAPVDALSYCGDTPLHLAFYPQSAETLLMGGANPTLPNNKGVTPLANAQEKGYGPVAEVIRRWIAKQ
jgi:ankyrin repeat protein